MQQQDVVAHVLDTRELCQICRTRTKHSPLRVGEGLGVRSVLDGAHKGITGLTATCVGD
jgi:hypothetical protein